MVLQPFVVASQPTLDLVGGLLEAGVRLVRAPLGLQIHTRTQMKRTIRPISRPLRRDHNVTADLAIEIMRNHRLDLVEHVLPKRFTDVEVLAGYSQWHESSSLLSKLPNSRKSSPA